MYDDDDDDDDNDDDDDSHLTAHELQTYRLCNGLLSTEDKPCYLLKINPASAVIHFQRLNW